MADSGPWWVQAYVLRDRQLTVELLDRARQAGAKAVVLTADTPVVGQKYRTGPSVWETVPPEHLLANVDQQGVGEAQLEKAADLTPQRLLTELTAELAQAMALAGTPDIPSLTRDLVSG
nr:alpha-hydroxy-acid oxidizing protein [Streptomyces yunnanensis]